MTDAAPAPEGRGGAEPPGWATAAALAAVLAACYALRYALLPVAFAAALAFVLRPAVGWLQRRLRVPKFAGVLIVYLAVLAAAALAAWYLVGVVGEEAVGAAADAPRLVTEQVERMFGPRIHLLGRDIRAEDLADGIVGSAEDVLARPGAALVAGTAAVGAPAAAVLTLVLLFYFLNSGRQILQGALHLIPPRHRGHVALLGARVEPMLRRYVRGVIAVTLYTAATAWLVLGPWFHAPFAPLVSLAVGVLELIPVVGPAASLALFGLLAVVDGHGLATVLGFVGLAVFLRVSVDNVVGPLVLGRAVTLHPAAVIVAFLAGASLFGVLGVFVAVPVAAAVKIVLAVWYGEDGDGTGRHGTGAGDPSPAPVARKPTDTGASPRATPPS